MEQILLCCPTERIERTTHDFIGSHFPNFSQIPRLKGKRYEFNTGSSEEPAILVTRGSLKFQHHPVVALEGIKCDPLK